MKEHADDQGCPLILSEGTGYTVDILLSISKPSYPRSESLGHDSMWINDLFSALSDGYDQHIVLFPRLSGLPFIEQGLGTISFLTPHPALGWFAASQSCPCYLTPVAWNNLPASVVVSDKASTFKNQWVDANEVLFPRNPTRTIH